MLKKFIKLAVIASSLVSMTSCSTWHSYDVKDIDLVEASYDAVDDLHDRIKRKIPKHSLVIVTTLLNVDNQNKTSAFGRIVSDQIASAFHQKGYQIIGMELPIDLFSLQADGSLQLSDTTKKLLKRYQPAVLIGGVYAPGKKNAYVSLRVINTHDKTVLATHDFAIPMGPDAKLLMTSQELRNLDEAAARATLESAIKKENQPVEAAETTNDTEKTDTDKSSTEKSTTGTTLE